MVVTFLGATTLLFDDGTDQILFDALLSRPPFLKAILGHMETDKPVADRILRDYDISRLRAIFISHTHHDHVLDAAYISNACGATIYGSESAMNIGRGGSVPEDRLVLFHQQDEFNIGKFNIRILPSVHSKPNFLVNNLGQVIDRPLRQPARLRDFKEGGSVDFLIKYEDRTFLIRPSCNYLVGELDGIDADVVFLGIGGLSRGSDKERGIFFRETLEKTHARTIIPVHWDNFFRPFRKSVRGMPFFMDDTEESLRCLEAYCTQTSRRMIVQWPMTQMSI